MNNINDYTAKYKVWSSNGQTHRTDGPAIECSDGTKGWYLNGKRLTDEEVKIFNYLQTCPKKELLEYVGTIYAPIVERRLK